MKKGLLYILMALCLSVAVPNNIYAETSQPITDEQNKQIQAASAYIEKLMEARQYSMACALAYELTRRFPNEPIGYYLLGTARMDSGYYEAAIKAYDDCVKVDSKYYNGYIYRGLAKYQLARYKEAVKDYNIAIKMDIPQSDKIIAYANTGIAKYCDCDFKGAIAEYNKAIELNPQSKTIDSIYYNRGKCYYELGDELNATDDYKKATELNPNAKYQTYVKNKEKEVRQERVRSSKLTLDQMREVNKFGDEIESEIVKRKYKKAASIAEKFIEKYPNEPDAIFAVAKTSYYLGDSKKAIEYYTKCYETDKSYYPAIINRGVVKYQNKDYKGAIKDYTLAIKITKYENSTLAQAYGNRGVAKYFAGQLKSALKDFNKVFEIDPNLPNIDQIYFNRGLCRYDLGDKAGADEDYNKARKLNPKRKYIYYDKRG